MPTKRLSMRRIREVLRLRHQGLTERVIARMLGVSNGVVHGYVRRARLAGLRRDENDALSCARAVQRTGGRALQDLDVLDVVRVDVRRAIRLRRPLDLA